MGGSMDQEWWKRVPPLKLDREGRWYDQGARVTNPRLAEFLLTHLTVDGDGRYIIAVGREKRYVDVEDAPYRALGVEAPTDPNAVPGLLLRLNDGSIEPFDPGTLWIAEDGSPYCLVRDRAHKVRFTAEAYRQLSAFIVEDATTGHFHLQIGHVHAPLPDLSRPSPAR
jgi:hypothetical protein